MTGKELIQATYRHEKTERPPWVPYAGIHAAKFKGYTATEILKDADKLVECLMEVHRLYRPDGQPIAFDLQLEAEILGCELIWADDNPPSVTSHPLENTEEIPDKVVGPNDGPNPVGKEAARRDQAHGRLVERGVVERLQPIGNLVERELAPAGVAGAHEALHGHEEEPRAGQEADGILR